MGNLYGQAREQAMSDDRGFRPHPIGQFNGTVEEVRAGQHEGRDFYEVKVRTKYGLAKQTLWRARESDLERHYLPKANGDRNAAIEALQKVWMRHARLYVDLGLQPPADEVQLYEQLGTLVGRKCWLVVKAADDPSNPFIFINAPRANGVDKNEQPTPAPFGNQAAAAPAQGSAAPFGGPTTMPTSAPPMDSVPF